MRHPNRAGCSTAIIAIRGCHRPSPIAHAIVMPNGVNNSTIDHVAERTRALGTSKMNRNKRPPRGWTLRQTLPNPLAQKVRIHAMRQRQPRYRRTGVKARRHQSLLRRRVIPPTAVPKNTRHTKTNILKLNPCHCVHHLHSGPNLARNHTEPKVQGNSRLRTPAPQCKHPANHHQFRLATPDRELPGS